MCDNHFPNNRTWLENLILIIVYYFNVKKIADIHFMYGLFYIKLHIQNLSL